MMKKIVFIMLMIALANVGVKAQRVITLSQGHNVTTEKITPLYRPTGNDIRIAIGGPIFVGIEYNRWVKSWLMVGAGLGYGHVGCAENITVPAYNTYFDTSFTILGYGFPFYLEAELRTPKYKWSTFFNLKVGYGAGITYYYEEFIIRGINERIEVNYEWKPFFMIATAGFGYKRFSMGIGAGVLGGRRYGSILIAYDIPF